MPRSPSDLKSYAVRMTPADADTAMQLAARLGLLTERGEPSRSAAIRYLIRVAAEDIQETKTPRSPRPREA
jgi:hypothetical protein